MSMWARLGRFLEIYGPKFWDFDNKIMVHVLKTGLSIISTYEYEECRDLWYTARFPLNQLLL
jgi:hypothetical protein